MNKDQLRDFAITAQRMIDAGDVEDRLRHFLSSRLAKIFPESPWWVQAHMQGTEEYVHFSSERGKRSGYVDAVVGKTAIEYEKNLKIQGVFNEGYHQVKEYCAALYNIGIPENEILGVLSDTVRWYGYKAKIIGKVEQGQLCGPNDVELIQLECIDLSLQSDNEFIRFEQFINQFMARDESRLLNAHTLALDFGVDSSFYREAIQRFAVVVTNAMSEKPDYAALIKQVWQNFIAYLGASDYGTFSIDTYVSEFYLVTVAKIICANILANRAVISSDEEIRMILCGKYFSAQNIYNLVDYDYFGWLNNAPYVDGIVECAKEMQLRLRAYDFSRLGEQDLFGKLLAQLANKEHRLMLGQEFTPHWVAKDIVDFNLDKIGDEPPQIMDMCCGSGVFLIEAIKAIRQKYGITADCYDTSKDAIAFSCIMGFDIDPLAVMLAKVNWVMTMRDLFPFHSESITVPIYHADSLFVATPITHRMPTKDEDYYVLEFDHQEVKLPAFLFSSAYRGVFDSFISKIYRLAMTRAEFPAESNEPIETNALISTVVTESGIELTSTEKAKLNEAAQQLIAQLEALQRHGRNGIWYFIISNSYRPGLAKQQFNCIVSNPPWMAMSKLADNPYKNALREIAKKYSIEPKGAAHPHMELASIFLVSSIDRYLKDGACWSCIMPASLMSGLNHEPFRKKEYYSSDMELEMDISSIWELPTDTFKNKAVVLSGEKAANADGTSIDGRIYSSAQEYEVCTYTLNCQGKRSAWTNRGTEAAVIDTINNGALNFAQGCDLFPRTVLFHKYARRLNGNVDIAPITRTDELWYLLSDSKKEICNALSAENFDKAYIYSALISKHLSPFVITNPVDVLIPGRKEQGIWKTISPADLALMNASTTYVFQQIVQGVGQELAPYLDETINIYGKLYRQNFTDTNWLVLSSASGSNPCAAYLSLECLDRNRLVIDQTLYWYLATSEEEALYLVGLLNSEVLSNAITDFQPEGGFGKRHIHTLPYKIIPMFDGDNEFHSEVVTATRALIEEWKKACMNKPYSQLLNPNSGTLNSRRRRQQAMLKTLPSYERYAIACTYVLA